MNSDPSFSHFAENSGKRCIVIGDIHGCYDELTDLLQVVKPTAEDELISVGDLICKGPKNREVLDWAMNVPNLRGVIGNHEARLLKYWRLGKKSAEKSYDADVYAQLGSIFEQGMRFLETWPLFIDMPQFNVVHAGIDPTAGALASQLPEDLLNIRTLKNQSPWYENYFEKKLIVFGHWARPEVIVRENCVGLDSGCVYGGKLSALILPERRLVQVPARRVYREKTEFATTGINIK